MLLQRLGVRAALACALAASTLPAGPAEARQVTLILVCAATVAPADCTRETASDVIVGRSAATPYGCLIGGMTTVARFHEGQAYPATYAMTRCEGRPD